jgi:S1-C subfamily serine protease
MGDLEDPGGQGAMNSKISVVCLAISLVLYQEARAETVYRWVDAQGIPHVDSQRPTGTQYLTIEVPDSVAWNNRPEMPAEIGTAGTSTTQNLFKLASQSVYRVLGRQRTGLDNSVLSVYGSAVAITESLAITNCHVIHAAGEDVYIGASGSEAVVKADLEASNYLADRCVVRVRDLTLHPATGIRRYESLEIGESVYAIGNPGRLDRTLSDGLVSGKREIGQVRFVQTTAPISPGSSGGGLFDARGNLVAITSMSLKGAQNINFAIPAEDYWK